jgi:hypothetical protein
MADRCRWQLTCSLKWSSLVLYEEHDILHLASYLLDGVRFDVMWQSRLIGNAKKKREKNRKEVKVECKMWSSGLVV